MINGAQKRGRVVCSIAAYSEALRVRINCLWRNLPAVIESQHWWESSPKQCSDKVYAKSLHHPTFLCLLWDSGPQVFLYLSSRISRCGLRRVRICRQLKEECKRSERGLGVKNKPQALDLWILSHFQRVSRDLSTHVSKTIARVEVSWHDREPQSSGNGCSMKWYLQALHGRQTIYRNKSSSLSGLLQCLLALISLVR